MNDLQAQGLNTEEYFLGEVSQDQIEVLLDRILSDGELKTSGKDYYIEDLNDFLDDEISLTHTQIIQCSDYESRQAHLLRYEEEVLDKSLDWVSGIADDVLAYDASMSF